MSNNNNLSFLDDPHKVAAMAFFVSLTLGILLAWQALGGGFDHLFVDAGCIDADGVIDRGCAGWLD